ncbi:MAG: hypothetical protein AAF270_01090 [Pseudomonadota bacterium]
MRVSQYRYMRTYFLIAVVAVVIVSALAYSIRERTDDPDRAALPAASTAAAQTQLSSSADGGVEIDTSDRDRALEAYFEPLRFRDDIEAFLATLDSRSMDENLAEAERLAEQIREQQAAGYLTHAQALYLEGTMQARIHADDPVARAQALEAVKRAYSERAEPPSTAHLDERFERYKQREAAIVQRALAGNIPDGKSQDEYLREQLDALRAEIYGESP